MGEARTPHTATIPLATARSHRAIPNRDASNASQVLLLLDFILSMIVWRRRQPLVSLAVPISTGSGSAYLTLGRLWGLRWPHLVHLESRCRRRHDRSAAAAAQCRSAGDACAARGAARTWVQRGRRCLQCLSGSGRLCERPRGSSACAIASTAAFFAVRAPSRPHVHASPVHCRAPQSGRSSWT